MPTGGLPAGFTPGGAGTTATTANLMPPPQGGGVAMATTTQTTPYSGFDRALKKWGVEMDTTILRDLKWQKAVDGDTQKK